jgi:hypothetical protein
MPIHPQSNQNKNHSDSDSTREKDHETFVELLTKHRTALRGIRIQAKAGGSHGAWRKKPLEDFAIPTAAELQAAAGEVDIDPDLRDETPQEIAEQIEEFCASYAERESVNLFKCTIYDADGKVLDDCKLTFIDGDNASDDGEARSDLLNIQGKTVKTMHGLYLELAKRACDLVKVVSESPFAAAAVEKVKADADVAKHQADTIVEHERTRQYGSAVNKFADHVAPKVGVVVDVFAEKIRQEANKKDSPPQSSRTHSERLTMFLGRMPITLQQQICDIVESDQWNLLNEATQADNESFKNICKEFRTRVPTSKMLAVHNLIGAERSTELLGILADAGAL